jgi:hypothetical protein
MAQTNIVHLYNPLTKDAAFYVEGTLVVDGTIPDPDYTLRALGYDDYYITTQKSTRVRRSVRNPAELWFATSLNDNYDRVQAVEVTDAQRSADFVEAVLTAAQPTEADIEGAFKGVSFKAPGLRKAEAFLSKHGLETPAPALGTRNVPLPNVGDDIYVDGFNSSFRCVEGGIGRVKLLVGREAGESYEDMAKRAADAADMSAFDQDDDFDDDFDDENDFFSGPSRSSNGDTTQLGETDYEDIFLVLEEAPLDLINWKDVKNRQGELAAIYGQVRASVVVDKENIEPLATREELQAMGQAPE